MIEGGPDIRDSCEDRSAHCSGDRVAVDLTAIALLRSFGKSKLQGNGLAINGRSDAAALGLGMARGVGLNLSVGGGSGSTSVSSAGGAYSAGIIEFVTVICSCGRIL